MISFDLPRNNIRQWKKEPSTSYWLYRENIFIFIINEYIIFQTPELTYVQITEKNFINSIINVIKNDNENVEQKQLSGERQEP